MVYSLKRGRVNGHTEVDNGDAGHHHGQLAQANGATDALVLLGYKARLVLAPSHGYGLGRTCWIRKELNLQPFLFLTLYPIYILFKVTGLRVVSSSVAVAVSVSVSVWFAAICFICRPTVCLLWELFELRLFWPTFALAVNALSSSLFFNAPLLRFCCDLWRGPTQHNKCQRVLCAAIDRSLATDWSRGRARACACVCACSSWRCPVF